MRVEVGKGVDGLASVGTSGATLDCLQGGVLAGMAAAGDIPDA